MTRRAVAAALGAAWVASLSAGVPVGQAAPIHFTVRPGESRVEYVSGTQLGEFRGASTRVTGELVFDPQDPGRAQASVVAEPSALVSDNASRDRHMRETLLEVGRFPTAVFRTREFRPEPGAGGADGRGTLLGTLTLHGVEKPVSVPVHFTLDGKSLRADGQLTIALADFGMTPPRLLGLKVRDAVTLQIHLVAVSDGV